MKKKKLFGLIGAAFVALMLVNVSVVSKSNSNRAFLQSNIEKTFAQCGGCGGCGSSDYVYATEIEKKAYSISCVRYTPKLETLSSQT